MSGIFIRAFFGEWKPATREKALAFARFMDNGITTIPDAERRAAYINERHLRGVTFTPEELRWKSFSKTI